MTTYRPRWSIVLGLGAVLALVTTAVLLVLPRPDPIAIGFTGVMWLVIGAVNARRQWLAVTEDGCEYVANGFRLTYHWVDFQEYRRGRLRFRAGEVDHNGDFFSRWAARRLRYRVPVWMFPVDWRALPVRSVVEGVV
ncbi:hypothetical protein [Actinokineospora inagensis]|uniref:hypothetical protein n=1 Tax=Actinokineospora inagensis TaxID=103730 RepID=UPI0003FD21E8|nr:hypothetical protein [Actinokineospora inagensis]